MIINFLIIIQDKNEVTTGAENDLEKATQLIMSMICDYGMSEKYGYLNLHALNEKPEDLSKVAAEMSETLYQRTEKLLKEQASVLDCMADILLEKETLTGDEIEEIMRENWSNAD